MNLRTLAILSLLLTAGARSQNVQNALDLDGDDDQITVPNAASLITTNTGYTMTCWVRPTNPYPISPDFDGICGFRNNNGADFFLVREGPTAIRGRFRNSVGDVFNIMPPVIQANQWQHVALVYNGSSITMYYNGVVPNFGSVQANGWMGGAIGPFLIGGQPYSSSGSYYLQGQIDEVSLWNTGLSQQEIQCIYESGIDTAAAGLQLYYSMDQGVAGADNTSITSLTDVKGNINGNFSNMTLDGPSSNFVTGPALGNVVYEEVCQGESYTFNGQVLTQPGTYTESFATGGACDSVVTLVLSHTPVNVDVVNSNGLLISQAVGAQYQWLDCANGFAPIAGETAPTYDPAEAGSFAVEVTQTGCTDTSACVAFVGLAERTAMDGVDVLFDATLENVVIKGASGLHEVRLDLMDAHGRIVKVVAVQDGRATIATSGLPDGMYIVSISSEEGRRAFRVIIAR